MDASYWFLVKMILSILGIYLGESIRLIVFVQVIVIMSQSGIWVTVSCTWPYRNRHSESQVKKDKPHFRAGSVLKTVAFAFANLARTVLEGDIGT